MSNDSRDAAIREAKRFVREVVRNDWEFDPSTRSDGPQNNSSSACATGTLPQNREVSEWRCREFDSSGSELEPQASDHELDLESPSALRAAGDPGIERRRKRRRQMEEEMAWNEGLRMWMARRDAWSGARTRRQIRAKQQQKKKKRKSVEGQTPLTDESAVDGVNSGDEDGAGTSPPADSQGRSETGEASALSTKAETSLSIEDSPRRQDLEEEQSTAPDDEKRKESTETSITEPDAQASAKDPSSLTTFPTIEDTDEDTDSDNEQEKEEEELDEPLIPVAPPFISSANPIRATINPSVYQSIYTKVVVQGMTPTVTVNLADLTKAMVQGWKADGQWPPKPAVSSIVLQDDATVPKTGADRPADAPTQGRRKNSITHAMRKVFHLGSHPFHRRGSSSHETATGNAVSPN